MVFFLLVNIVAGAPQLTIYTDQAGACAAYAGAQGSHVYQIENKRSGAVITEGDCKPVIQFKTKN